MIDILLILSEWSEPSTLTDGLFHYSQPWPYSQPWWRPTHCF